MLVYCPARQEHHEQALHYQKQHHNCQSKSKSLQSQKQTRHHSPFPQKANESAARPRHSDVQLPSRGNVANLPCLLLAVSKLSWDRINRTRLECCRSGNLRRWGPGYRCTQLPVVPSASRFYQGCMQPTSASTIYIYTCQKKCQIECQNIRQM